MGADDMGLDPRHRGVGVARGQGIDDGGVLLPDAGRDVFELQHRSHGPAQMLPVQPHGVDDQRIARQFVEKHVEVHVGFDHAADILAPRHRLPLRHQGAAGRDPFGRDPRRRQPDRERLDRRAELVDGMEQPLVDRRDGEAAAAAGADEALRLQDQERVVNRLARNLQPLRHVRLRQPLAGAQAAVANRIEQGGIGLVDQGFSTDQGAQTVSPVRRCPSPAGLA